MPLCLISGAPACRHRQRCLAPQPRVGGEGRGRGAQEFLLFGGATSRTNYFLASSLRQLPRNKTFTAEGLK